MSWLISPALFKAILKPVKNPVRGGGLGG